MGSGSPTGADIYYAAPIVAPRPCSASSWSLDLFRFGYWPTACPVLISWQQHNSPLPSHSRVARHPRAPCLEAALYTVVPLRVSALSAHPLTTAMRPTLLLALASLALQSDAAFDWQSVVARHRRFVRDARVALRSLSSTRHAPPQQPNILSKRAANNGKCMAVPSRLQVGLSDGTGGNHNNNNNNDDGDDAGTLTFCPATYVTCSSSSSSTSSSRPSSRPSPSPSSSPPTSSTPDSSTGGPAPTSSPGAGSGNYSSPFKVEQYYVRSYCYSEMNSRSRPL